MGTETIYSFHVVKKKVLPLVKLNNPLMGTETCGIFKMLEY